MKIKKKAARPAATEGREYVVSIKHGPAIVVRARDQEEAVEKFKKICLVVMTEHGFKVRAVEAGKRPKTDANGVVLASRPKIASELGTLQKELRDDGDSE
jgi:hypothetical protein